MCSSVSPEPSRPNQAPTGDRGSRPVHTGGAGGARTHDPGIMRYLRALR
jgi:hypothetical protein